MTAACPPLERVAAAATTVDDELVAHARDCARCQALVDEQRAMRSLVAGLAAPPLPRARREAISAEVMARADLLAPPRRGGRRIRTLAGLGLAAVAAAGIAAWMTDRGTTTTVPAVTGAPADATAVGPPVAAAPERGSGATSVPPDDAPAAVARTSDPAPPSPARPVPRVTPARLEGAADFARDTRGERDVVNLRGGELTVDAVDARPVQVVGGGTRIAVRQAKVAVVSRAGVIATVRVFAGSAEVIVDGERVIVEAGATWERPVGDADGVAAFREGWAALREGRHADAVAALDRAVDPVVAEDARYWSAVASERAGDVEGAVRRYQRLIDEFPRSPRVLEARAAITRLAEPSAP